MSSICLLCFILHFPLVVIKFCLPIESFCSVVCNRLFTFYSNRFRLHKHCTVVVVTFTLASKAGRRHRPGKLKLVHAQCLPRYPTCIPYDYNNIVRPTLLLKFCRQYKWKTLTTKMILLIYTELWICYYIWIQYLLYNKYIIYIQYVIFTI